MKKLIPEPIYGFLRSIYHLYGLILNLVRLNYIKAKWLDLNKHNRTIVGNTIDDIAFPIDLVTVGDGTYGPLKVYSYRSINEKLIIGNYCSISSGVLFILGGNHRSEIFSTYPFKYFFTNEEESLSKGPIIIEDDVWIGTNSVILSGVTISKGTIVAAGSIVTKSTIPYSIIGGNPSKLIKMRFNQEIIDEMMNFNYHNLDFNIIRQNMEKLYKKIDLELVQSILNTKKINEKD
jgi:acetyltransferase-like isoleucine patch superfamily enzyme